jgi:hypothetical protein
MTIADQFERHRRVADAHRQELRELLKEHGREDLLALLDVGVETDDTRRERAERCLF